MVQLIFWDKRQININKWIEEENKKLHNVKFLWSIIHTDEQKEILKQYTALVDENKHTRDKYIRSLNKIKAENIIQWLIEPILKAKAEYFNEYYNSTLALKREEYIKKMKKKLKVEREIIAPF